MGPVARIPKHRETADSMRRLSKHNIKYYSVMHNYLQKGTPEKRAKAAKARAAYLTKLEKKPFFRELLAKKERVEFSYRGKKHSFTLLTNGIGWKGSGKESVIVLDDAGRANVMMIYNVNGGLCWQPSMVAFMEKEGKRMWTARPHVLGGNWAGVYDALSTEIWKREGKLMFNGKWTPRKLLQVKKYL